MYESRIVYSVDVVFMLHSRPDNFVESGDCQQSQPIQKLHQGVKSVTPGTRYIEQLSGTVHLCPSNMDCALSTACAHGIQHPFGSAKVAHDSGLSELTFRLPFILC